LLPRPITNTFLFATAYILTGPVEENCAKRATRMRSCLYRMEFVRFTANLALQSWWPLLGSVHLGGRPAGGTAQRHYHDKRRQSTEACHGEHDNFEYWCHKSLRWLNSV